MRILFLTARLPYPPTRGDRLRAYHFLRVLSREHRLTLLSFIGDEGEAAHLSPLRVFCEDIQLVHRAPWQSTLGAAAGLWRPLPLQSLYYRSPVMQGAVDRLLARTPFDAVYVHLFRMAQYVSARYRPYRILDLTDAISGEVMRSLPYRDPLWRLVYRLELPRIRRYEREMVGRFDETWVISETERAAVAAEIGNLPPGSGPTCASCPTAWRRSATGPRCGRPPRRSSSSSATWASTTTSTPPSAWPRACCRACARRCPPPGST